MISFITKEKFKELQIEYRVRFVIVLCVFLTIIALVVFAFLFATALKVSISREIVDQQISKTQSDEIFGQRKQLDEKVTYLNKQLAQFNFSTISTTTLINSITANHLNGVRVSSIDINTRYIGQEKKDNKDTIMISLRGIAKTRNDLLGYQDWLKSSGLFSSIDIPYSNFAKTSDIQFTVGLISNPTLVGGKINFDDNIKK